jgi:hypothetical protein
MGPQHTMGGDRCPEEFSRMKWMRHKGMYEKFFLNTTYHKEGERNVSVFCTKLMTP